MKEYRWASLGCGVIANQLAEAMEKQGRKLYGIANRTHEKAVAFAKKYGVEKVYTFNENVIKAKTSIIKIAKYRTIHFILQNGNFRDSFFAINSTSSIKINKFSIRCPLSSFKNR